MTAARRPGEELFNESVHKIVNGRRETGSWDDTIWGVGGQRGRTHIILDSSRRDPFGTIFHSQSELKNGWFTELSEQDSRYLTMLHYILWGVQWPGKTLVYSITQLHKNPVTFAELQMVLNLRADVADQLPKFPEMPAQCVLELHAEYSRDEILCAFGLSTVDIATQVREMKLSLACTLEPSKWV